MAVPVNDSLREKLTELKNKLDNFPELFKKVRWIKPENFHLTLKFFGEVEEENLPVLKNALSDTARAQRDFEMEFTGAGCFPDLKRPRVLWVGVGEGSEELKKLAEKVEKNVIAKGFAPEVKPFSSHLSIARFPLHPSQTFPEKIASYKNSFFGKVKVERIELIQSLLSSAGSHYTLIEAFHFSCLSR